ncbi:N-acetylmuramoyl-L-alanine amidase [Phosphitispora sp. TUW77]|uniref:N-acetylmuramoyl-L-alanine amidase n=1 Tax=Phosphitispora sp. TUW77 TaxID=3152361 RepID=UPI003AB49D88
MNLRKLILTNNACFKAGKTITPKGIMVHSTGANNPWLKRYIGPDDGFLGKNQYNNHWNQDKPGGRQVCVHAFIGKLVDGTIATYQTLPWNHRGWHAGGKANDTHIGFEICEDGLSDSTYFGKVYREAVELCVHLCKLYGLTEKNIICHSEGHKLGIASNHADVMHWFPKHGKSMDTFRTDVKSALNPINSSPKPKDILYRVRKSWDDAKSQKGAYKVLENAKRCADANSGYSVFDEDGQIIYSGKSAPTYEIYTVVKGDSLWKIAKEKLGNGERYTEIKVFNGLTTNIIYAGQKLKIPN